MRKILLTSVFSIAAGAALAQTPPAPPAVPPPPSNVVQQSSEYRFQLDLHVNDALLAKMLPAGWVSNAATTGAAKDANLRMIFIDEVNLVGPDNKMLGKGTNRLVYLAAPVKQSAGAGTGQMILSGIAENTDTPDAFGVLLKATNASMARSASDANGVVQVSEDWDFTAAGGEHMQLHVKYIRGGANKGGGAAETKFYNPADPTKYLGFKTEQATDITRNVTTNPPDRVSEFSFKAGGGKLTALFDGSEKPLSWDSQPTYSRTVSTPAN